MLSVRYILYCVLQASCSPHGLVHNKAHELYHPYRLFVKVFLIPAYPIPWLISCEVFIQRRLSLQWARTSCSCHPLSSHLQYPVMPTSYTFDAETYGQIDGDHADSWHRFRRCQLVHPGRACLNIPMIKCCISLDPFRLLSIMVSGCAKIGLTICFSRSGRWRWWWGWILSLQRDGSIA